MKKRSQSLWFYAKKLHLSQMCLLLLRNIKGSKFITERNNHKIFAYFPLKAIETKQSDREKSVWIICIVSLRFSRMKMNLWSVAEKCAWTKHFLLSNCSSVQNLILWIYYLEQSKHSKVWMGRGRIIANNKSKI